MSNERENTPMISREKGQKSEPTRTDISVEGPVIEKWTRFTGYQF